MKLCPSCSRHLKRDQATCPFCQVTILVSNSPLAAISLAAGLALAGCNGDDGETTETTGGTSSTSTSASSTTADSTTMESTSTSTSTGSTTAESTTMEMTTSTTTSSAVTTDAYAAPPVPDALSPEAPTDAPTPSTKKRER
ncbi:MAG: hypothetical protein R3B09_30240 [Nannocystaceae bacterium]